MSNLDLIERIRDIVSQDGPIGIQGRAILVNAEIALELFEWQPIETAPKDGTEIILCDMNWPRVDGYRPRKIGLFYAGKWLINGGSWEPTHWMPLPPPPQ